MNNTTDFCFTISKCLLEKAATTTKNKNSLLGSKLKKQPDIANDQYKFFKDLINVNNNNGEDDVKTEEEKSDQKKTNYNF